MYENQSKMAYFLEGFETRGVHPDVEVLIKRLMAMQNMFQSAIREVTTKLEILNDEFRYTMDRNPIHQIKSRVKTPKSIMDKLERKNIQLYMDIAPRAIQEQLDDIAGIRVICSYIDDIYTIAQVLTDQDDLEVIRVSDYIKNPKPNGYRSLHLILKVPVFLSSGKTNVKVEVQIRTIAMDFWASLEHELSYKLNTKKPSWVDDELRSCAEMISQADKKMQSLYNTIHAQRPNDIDA